MADPLATLHDIHLPLSMWLIPLSIATILILCLLIMVMVKRWLKRTSVRRTAFKELAEIMIIHQQNNDDGQLVLSMSQLLRRFAQKRWSEADCVSLTGKDWLAFLESRNGTGEFIAGAGSVLAWRPYSATGEVDPKALQLLLHRWLKENSI